MQRNLWSLVGVGLANGVAAALIFGGLSYLDPSVTAFLARSGTLCSIVLGYAVLGERFSGRCGIGMVLILSGVGVITYSSSEAQLLGIVLVLVGYVFDAVGAQPRGSDSACCALGKIRLALLASPSFCPGGRGNDGTIPWPDDVLLFYALHRPLGNGNCTGHSTLDCVVLVTDIPRYAANLVPGSGRIDCDHWSFAIDRQSVGGENGDCFSRLITGDGCRVRLIRSCFLATSVQLR